MKKVLLVIILSMLSSAMCINNIENLFWEGLKFELSDKNVLASLYDQKNDYLDHKGELKSSYYFDASEALHVALFSQRDLGFLWEKTILEILKNYDHTNKEHSLNAGINGVFGSLKTITAFINLQVDDDEALFSLLRGTIKNKGSKKNDKFDLVSKHIKTINDAEFINLFETCSENGTPYIFEKLIDKYQKTIKNAQYIKLLNNSIHGKNIVMLKRLIAYKNNQNLSIDHSSDEITHIYTTLAERIDSHDQDLLETAKNNHDLNTNLIFHEAIKQRNIYLIHFLINLYKDEIEISQAIINNLRTNNPKDARYEMEFSRRKKEITNTIRELLEEQNQQNLLNEFATFFNKAKQRSEGKAEQQFKQISPIEQFLLNLKKSLITLKAKLTILAHKLQQLASNLS